MLGSRGHLAPSWASRVGIYNGRLGRYTGAFASSMQSGPAHALCKRKLTVFFGMADPRSAGTLLSQQQVQQLRSQMVEHLGAAHVLHHDLTGVSIRESVTSRADI